MFVNLDNKKIPINLLNGRITKKSFSKWKYFSNFSKKLFSKFNLCLSASTESKYLLKSLGVKKGKKIPAKKLNAAAKKPGKLGQRARLAKTLKGLKK